MSTLQNTQKNTQKNLSAKLPSQKGEKKRVPNMGHHAYVWCAKYGTFTQKAEI